MREKKIISQNNSVCYLSRTHRCHSTDRIYFICFRKYFFFHYKHDDDTQPAQHRHIGCQRYYFIIICASCIRHTETHWHTVGVRAVTMNFIFIIISNEKIKNPTGLFLFCLVRFDCCVFRSWRNLSVWCKMQKERAMRHTREWKGWRISEKHVYKPMTHFVRDTDFNKNRATALIEMKRQRYICAWQYFQPWNEYSTFR